MPRITKERVTIHRHPVHPANLVRGRRPVRTSPTLTHHLIHLRQLSIRKPRALLRALVVSDVEGAGSLGFDGGVDAFAFEACLECGGCFVDEERFHRGGDEIAVSVGEDCLDGCEVGVSSWLVLGRNWCLQVRLYRFEA